MDTKSGLLHVAMQARDIDGNLAVAKDLYTKAQISDNVSLYAISKCTADLTTGSCIATLTFPTDFFSTSLVRALTVYTGKSVSLLSALANITVYLQPKPAVYSVVNDVVVELPQQNLFRGNSFNVNVQGSTTKAIGAYSIDCSVDIMQLIITGASASSTWTVTKNIQGGLLKITASPTNVATIPNRNVSSETLFTMNLQVVATAMENFESSISCIIVTLADKDGNNVKPRGFNLPTPARFIDRSGVVTGASGGQVFVAGNSIRGILPFVAQAEIGNTATLNGIRQSSFVTVLAVQRSGSMVAVVNGLACNSSNTAVISSDTNCNEVFLLGNETAGGVITITVTATTTDGSFSGSFPVKVWFCNRVTLALSDYVLNAIPNLANPLNSCLSGFQQTHLTANASFTSDQDATRVYIIVPIPSSSLSFDNSTVARLVPGSTVNAQVQGLSAGSTVIIFRSFAKLVLATTTISVSDISVNVQSMSVRVITGLVAGNTVVSGVTATVSFYATSTLNQ